MNVMVTIFLAFSFIYFQYFTLSYNNCIYHVIVAVYFCRTLYLKEV